jgi:hypothetical protein
MPGREQIKITKIVLSKLLLIAEKSIALNFSEFPRDFPCGLTVEFGLSGNRAAEMPVVQER